jgi:hypothetical protein
MSWIEPPRMSERSQSEGRLVTFVPGADKSALALAMTGGLLIMAWMVLFALRLFRLAKKNT